MTDLLDSDEVVIARQRRIKPSQLQRTARVAPPSPASPKEFFVAIRTLASGEYITTNLSRAVLKTIQESASNAPRQEIDEITGLQKGYEILEESVSDLRSNQLNDRLALLVHDAERMGRLPEVVESLLRITATSKHEAANESFLDRARRLDEHGQTDFALDMTFDQIDEMLLAGEFDCVNQLLADIATDEYSVELLLGILTATLPAKDRLPNRAEFLQRVSRTLEDRGELKEGLLVGLD